MSKTDYQFIEEIWAFDDRGVKVHPYVGQIGPKKGLYSVNFTNDTKKFTGFTRAQVIEAVLGGRFKNRGTIRMLPMDFGPDTQRNAFVPEFYEGHRVKDL